VHGYLASLLSIGKGNVSGYNKDTQWTKYLIMDSIFTCQDAPILFKHVLEGIEPNKEKLLKQTQEGFLCATDLADMLVREGKIPFRRAYLIVKESTNTSKDKIEYTEFNTIVKKHEPKINITQDLFEKTTNPNLSIHLKNHEGGPAPLALKKLKTKLNQNLKKIKTQHQKNSNKIK
jgi:argininosuccinate lyase